MAPAGKVELNADRCFTGGSNSVVESQPSKLLVAGSIPVSRSRDLAVFLDAEPRNGTQSPAAS